MTEHITAHPHRRLGRLARRHDPRVPKWARVRRAPTAPAPPSCDWGASLPRDLGMMLNDQLGDCVEACVGHAIQTWTHATAPAMLTPTDAEIEAAYAQSSGYVPGDASTDNGSDEQTVLQWWLNNAVDANALTAYVEIDAAALPDVRRAVYECGVVMNGFQVPAYLMDSYTAPGSVWDVRPTLDNTSVGGHCVAIVGYDQDSNFTVISWGAFYTMTAAFWTQWVDEAYALVDPAWVTATGNTPAGLTLAELASLMQPLKFTPSSGARRQHRRRKRQRERRDA